MTQAERLRYLRLKAKAGQPPPSTEAVPSDAPPPESVDWLTALGRGLGQGATASFGDEAGGLVEMLSGAGGYTATRDALRQENAAAAKQWPKLSMLGNIAGGVPLAIATAGKGKTLGAMLKTGALLGGAGGLGGSDSDLTRGDIGELGGALLDTGLGSMFGMAGAGLGHGAGKAVGAGAKWLADKAGKKSVEATAKIAQLAKDATDKVTQQARSAAGRDAQALYRTLEHLRDLEKSAEPWAKAELAALQRQGINPAAIEAELYEKSVTKLPEIFGAAKTSATEFGEALKSAPGRLAEATERVGNPWNQLLPRLKRYGPVALGALAGHYLFPGMGAGGGGFAGAALRPTLHALWRMSKHPSVQRPMWNTLGGLARGVAYDAGAAPALAGQSGRALAPKVEEALLPMLLAAQRPEEPALATLGGAR